MALFKYGFKRKYEGFCESFFVKVYMYNLPINFSVSKLSCIQDVLAALSTGVYKVSPNPCKISTASA